jgi:hypothetical protein
MKIWHFGIFFSLYILYHLFTLSISPIVWTDEVAFNSMTLDWLNNGTYRIIADMQFAHGSNVLAYGPVWFFFNGIIINLFENSPFWGRFLGLISGLLIILVFAKWFKITQKNTLTISTILLISFSLDPFFNANLHRGRNDSLAILCFYLSNFLLLKSYIYDESNNIRVNLKFLFVSSLLFSVSILTTARVLMLAPSTFFVFIFILFQSRFSIKYILSGLSWALIVTVIYLSWIYYGFGGIKAYFEYYRNVNSRNSSFLGGNLLLPIEVRPILFCFIMSLGFVITNLKKNKINSTMIFCLGVILSFYFLVGDTGPYSVYVIPAYYLWFFTLIKNEFYFTNKYLRYGSLLGLLTFNLFVFGLKTTVLSADYSSRNISIANQFIKKNIPKNAKVCGDEVYYYSVLKNNDKFHLLISYQNDSEFDSVELFSRKQFDFDYLIVSSRILERCPNLIKKYQSNSSLIVLDTLRVPHNKLSKIIAPISGYNLSSTGYDGIIYKRIK